jgi:uncharacterized protein (UPF0333 family)
MRGQAAFEYLMMFSMVLAIISLLVYYAQGMTNSSMDDIAVSNAVIAVNKIAEASNIVYTQGAPSQMTLSVYIPENLQSIIVGNQTPSEFPNRMIIMKIRVNDGINDIFAVSKAPMQGNISIDSGTKTIKVKTISVGGDSYVNITQG